jgi:DtxR family Mn-dependent transcriptional regulator
MTMSSDTPTQAGLTPALEGYLFVIGELIARSRVARVKDIAKERGVKPGSVSPAMARLEKLGLIRYRQREFIELTPAGEQIARRVAERRQVLSRFFAEVLGMDPQAAGSEARSLEQVLSEEVCGRMARFLDPAGRRDAPPPKRGPGPRRQRRRTTLAELPAGITGSVAAIEAAPSLRNRLFDLGIVPDAMVRVDRAGGPGRPLVVNLSGFPVTLTAAEARAVVVDRS